MSEVVDRVSISSIWLFHNSPTTGFNQVQAEIFSQKILLQELESHLSICMGDHLKVILLFSIVGILSSTSTSNCQMVANTNRSSIESIRSEMTAQLKLRDEKIQELEKMLLLKVLFKSF
jgi:hypothetical protein